VTSDAATTVDDVQADDAEKRSRRLRLELVVVAVVAAVIAAVTVGWLIGDDGSADTPSTDSVDAGFARDMSTHHEQAVIMAGYERDNTTDGALKVLATDIETSQQFQIGEMNGWLDVWNLPYTTDQPHGAWMGGHSSHTSNGALMPGMATPSEMDKLRTLHGKALDTYFLQLMIRHHQGGLPMAEYALAHGQTAEVKSLALAVINSQQSEIVYMEQLLRKLGAEPLPPP
jgi:uncharacterized protein (DUF305 family)